MKINNRGMYQREQPHPSRGGKIPIIGFIHRRPMAESGVCSRLNGGATPMPRLAT